jgi:phosphoserine phosphatase
MNEVEAILEKFQRDIDYAEAHREALLNQYPEQWVAILDQQVVGAKPDVYQLIDDLKARGIPTQRALLRRLTRQGELLILARPEADALHL